MSISIFIQNTKGKFDKSFDEALDTAEEFYNTAYNEIDGEAECQNCETQKELNDLLRDKAERVSSEFELALRENLNEGFITISDFRKQIKYVDTIYSTAKENLEDAIHKSVKEELDW